MGSPERFMTAPRSTAVRIGSIASGATPSWVGFDPLYRNEVDVATLVATVLSNAGACAAGSAGTAVDLVLGPSADQFPAASPAWIVKV